MLFNQVLLHKSENSLAEPTHGNEELLKRGKGKFSHIILVPQPSDSPNDPLNWPLWKKDLILFFVGMSSSVVGAYGPMLGPGFVKIAAELGVTVNELSEATA